MDFFFPLLPHSYNLLLLVQERYPMPPAVVNSSFREGQDSLQTKTDSSFSSLSSFYTLTELILSLCHTKNLIVLYRASQAILRYHLMMITAMSCSLAYSFNLDGSQKLSSYPILREFFCLFNLRSRFRCCKWCLRRLMIALLFVCYMQLSGKTVVSDVVSVQTQDCYMAG